MAGLEIHISLPEEVLTSARLGREEVDEEMRRLLLLELVREGRVSYGGELGLRQRPMKRYWSSLKKFSILRERRNGYEGREKEERRT